MRLRSLRLSWPLVGVSTLLLACTTSGEPTPGSPQNAAAGAGGTQPSTTSGGSAGSGVEAGQPAMAGGNAAGGIGSGGTAGGGGSGGSAGHDSAAVTDAARPSPGCGQPSAIEPGKYQSSMLLGRATWVRLPATYDPMRAYPLIFVWKGCSAGGVSTFGIETVAGEDAIIAQGDFPPGADCYDTADGSTFTDLPLFDALREQIQNDYCVDQAHEFSVGFSSGAWLTQLLACQRGDVLRGIGTIAGAFKPSFLNGAPSCVGDGLSAFMVSDLDDHTNPFYDEDMDGDSVEVAVNHWLEANGCTEKPWTLQAGTAASPDESVCRTYAGCGRFPVELCLTMGKGHSAQESLSMPGFWQLFQQSLPK